jgi:long-chain acyl-CoA synthetase
MLAVQDRERYDTSTLKVAASGGASLPVEVLRGAEQAFGLTLLEGYGLSETSPVASFNHPDRPTKPGSVGTPLRGVEFGLRDDDDNEVADGEIGEIVIRGENVMKSYWNQSDATAEAMRGGWFHSGDLARRDETVTFIVDRRRI